MNWRAGFREENLEIEKTTGEGENIVVGVGGGLESNG